MATLLLGMLVITAQNNHIQAEGFFEQAKEHLEKAIAANPKHVASYMTCARLYIKEGDNEV